MSKPTHRSIAIASPYRRGLVELRHRLAAELAASNLARIRQVAAATVPTADDQRDGSDGAVFPVRTDPQRDSRRTESLCGSMGISGDSVSPSPESLVDARTFE